MKKPDSLRAYLTQALPALKRNPEALAIFLTEGTIAVRHGANLGFEQRYTLHLVLLNFRGEPEQIFLPLTLWLRVNQPELLLNHDSGVNDIRFNVDVLDDQSVDLEITLPLTEAVDVLPGNQGGYLAKTRDEMPVEDVPFADPLGFFQNVQLTGGKWLYDDLVTPDPE